MNNKKTIGEISKLLGVIFLVCAAVIFIRTAADNSAIKLLTFFGLCGLTLLLSGIVITRSIVPTEDEILGRTEKVHQ